MHSTIPHTGTTARLKLERRCLAVITKGSCPLDAPLAATVCGASGTLRTIVAEEGVGMLAKGWLPTFLGYSAQGMFKFGLYEYFKDLYSNIAGEEQAYKYRGPIYLLGSASAEFFADIALCPMEMVKVKVGRFTGDKGAQVLKDE